MLLFKLKFQSSHKLPWSYSMLGNDTVNISPDQIVFTLILLQNAHYRLFERKVHCYGGNDNDCVTAIFCAKK